MKQKKSVQFSEEPPRIIVAGLDKFGMEISPLQESLSDFSVKEIDSKKRIAKLVVIFLIPVVGALAQSGLYMERAGNEKILSADTEEALDWLWKIKSVISELQNERRQICILRAEDERDSINLTRFYRSTDTAFAKASSRRTPARFYSTLQETWHNLEMHRKNDSIRRGVDEELRWYADTIMTLVKLITSETRLKSDVNGSMWTYVIAYEILLIVREYLDIQMTLLNVYALTGALLTSHRAFFTENGSLSDILINTTVQHLPADKVFVDWSHERIQRAGHIRCLEIAFAKNDTGCLTESLIPGSPPINALPRTAALLEEFLRIERVALTSIQNRVAQELELLLGEQHSSVGTYFNLGVGLLTATSILCPILSIWYLRSVLDMTTLIVTYSDQMAQKTAQILFEKRRTEHLLYQMLPPSVADALKHGQEVPVEHYDAVTVFFSVIANFDSFTESQDPRRVIDLLNSLYSMMDDRIEQFDVYKVETIGDEYMVTSGLPKRIGDRHACEIADLSLDLLKGIENFDLDENWADNKISLRIGVNTGPCVAGVIGLKMPRYCLFGDTVNTASRMESSGLGGQAHVSSATKALLDQNGGYTCQSRGMVILKGKGEMLTWWLTGKRDLAFYLVPPATEAMPT